VHHLLRDNGRGVGHLCPGSQLRRKLLSADCPLSELSDSRVVGSIFHGYILASQYRPCWIPNNLGGGVFFSWMVEVVYNIYHIYWRGISNFFGEELNFFHRVVLVVVLCVMTHVVVSLTDRRHLGKDSLIWTNLTNHKSKDLQKITFALLLSITFFIILGWALQSDILSPMFSATLGALWTLILFGIGLNRSVSAKTGVVDFFKMVKDDRFWAGILCSIAVFMMYYFV